MSHSFNSLIALGFVIFSSSPAHAGQPPREELLTCEVTELVHGQIFENFDDQENSKVEVSTKPNGGDLKVVVGKNVFAEAKKDVISKKGSLDDDFSVTVQVAKSKEEIFLRQNGNSEIAEIFITNEDHEVPALVAVLACGSLVSAED